MVSVAELGNISGENHGIELLYARKERHTQGARCERAIKIKYEREREMRRDGGRPGKRTLKKQLKETKHCEKRKIKTWPRGQTNE